MNVLDLLAGDNYIIYNKTLAKEIGLENAIVFGALCSYQRSFKGEFFREQTKIMEDTCLTEYAVRKSMKDLGSLGLVNITKKGLPAKYYFEINTTRLIELLTTSGCGNDTTGSNENNTTSSNENASTNNIILNNNIKDNIKDNIKEKNIIKKEKFIPPTIDQVYEYANSRGRGDLAKLFYDYYTATNWTDSKGNKVKSWKGKFITWENNNFKKDSVRTNVIEEAYKRFKENEKDKGDIFI